MRIKNIVESLCRKYATRNPYELAEYKSFQIVKTSLGGIKGYYSTCYKQRIIHINSDISEIEQRHTCAHELGHGILHPDSNTPFLRANSLFPIGKYEKEAEHFAVDLLYSDEDLQEYFEFSTPQIAECLKLPIPLVEYRLSVIKKRLRLPV